MKTRKGMIETRPKFYPDILKRSDHLADTGEHNKIKLELSLKKYDVSIETGFRWHRMVSKYSNNSEAHEQILKSQRCDFFI
jgi:hypothetical protein